KCRRKGERAMRLKSLLKRLVDKIVKDALPAGLASILGGLLLTHFQIDRVPQPTTVKVTQASPEMMQLLRDDHGMIIDFVKDQVVSVTQRAVSATIGVIPSWFGSLGDRIGGEGQSPRPPANLVSASWIVPSAADR